MIGARKSGNEERTMNDRIDTFQKNYRLSHPLMFAIVMQDEYLCRELLNRILPERKVKEVRFPGGHNPKTIYHEIEKPLLPAWTPSPSAWTYYLRMTLPDSTLNFKWKYL